MIEQYPPAWLLWAMVAVFLLQAGAFVAMYVLPRVLYGAAVVAAKITNRMTPE